MKSLFADIKQDIIEGTVEAVNWMIPTFTLGVVGYMIVLTPRVVAGMMPL